MGNQLNAEQMMLSKTQFNPAFPLIMGTIKSNLKTSTNSELEDLKDY